MTPAQMDKCIVAFEDYTNNRPEDIAHEMAPDVPLVRPHPIEIPVAQDAALDREVQPVAAGLQL